MAGIAGAGTLPVPARISASRDNPMKWLDRLEETIIMLMMGLATLLTFTAVIHR